MSPNRDKLSGTDANGSGLASIATYPTLTTLHTVPPDETHTIWLTISNTHNSSSVELLGDVGETSDSLNHRLAAETTTTIGPITLVGGSSGTTLKLGAVSAASNIKISGSVERYRSTR